MTNDQTASPALSRHLVRFWNGPVFSRGVCNQIHASLFAEFCADFGMTPLQYSLLSALSDLGVADQTTLARAVAFDRTTTTGALKRLVARDLVRRVVSRDDRRAQVCRMTDAGVALLAAMEPAARRAHRSDDRDRSEPRSASSSSIC